ncbi:MAG TPA: hypothetical protein PKN13_06395, partial [Accumulibacter sp.]|nr:hypothetical protein [Accumulibacter sp.]HMW17430.1 hypothetical protein [Accumulibacter sp.]HMX22032.1 hypothetical protein [Accumulibacter sp.]HND80156.1 hypothetical protein [Accumulibacter sp.]HNE12805.1 hypothetical protein [Accumulibacter sp.]
SPSPPRIVTKTSIIQRFPKANDGIFSVKFERKRIAEHAVQFREFLVSADHPLCGAGRLAAIEAGGQDCGLNKCQCRGTKAKGAISTHNVGANRTAGDGEAGCGHSG